MDDIDVTEDPAGSVDGPVDDGPSLALDLEGAPARVGRYVLLREIGRGAIGVVYAAFHEGLDRRVAIKLLNRQRAGRVDLEARLHREARALAKLSHPNVVQVYDVGKFSGRVFVAMEFVEGRTLTEWLRGGPTREAVVAMFVAAGRGLEAAHAAGVVHRDFKPDNVLVGNEGRPRVLDFGLARPTELRSADDIRASRPGAESSAVWRSGTGLGRGLDADPGETRDAADASGSGVAFETWADPDGDTLGADGVSVDLTRTGALVGTPAYMSPEQFSGLTVDHRSDQFGFCVALYEAVYGARPFAGRSPMELALEVQTGPRQKVPAGKEAPGWLHAAMLRGLDPDPAKRWPSMTELLSQLEAGARPSRGWPLLVAGVLVVGAVGVVIAALDRDAAPTCPSADSEQAELWSPDSANRIRSSFASSELPYAAETSERVAAALERWSNRWARQRHDSCEAGLRHELSPDLLDHRQACLDRGRRAFMILEAQLLDADATVIERAVEASADLPEPEACADLDAMLADAERAPEPIADSVEALRSELAELDISIATGRWQLGRPAAELAVARARELGFGPVQVEAELRLALFDARLGTTDAALVGLQDALDQAERHDHERLIPRIATALVQLSIYDRPDPIRGRLWARRSLAALDRIGAQGVERARGLWMLGNLDRIDGDLEAAEANLRGALTSFEALDHPDRGAVLNDLGNVLDARGDRDGARRVYQQARSLSEASFGEGHPQVGHVEYNLARLAIGDGRLDDAGEHLDAALSIYRKALGEDRREIGDVAIARALLELHQGNLDEARTHAEQARDLFDRTLGVDNVDRAEPHLTLGHIALTDGQALAAVDHYQRGLAIQRGALPDDHITLATTSINLGLALHQSGDPAAAVTEFERATGLLEAGVVVDAAELRVARMLLGEALLARGGPSDPARAVALVSLAEQTCGPDTPEAERLNLVGLHARALAAAEQPDAARERAQAALTLVGEGTAPLDPTAMAELERLAGPR